MIIAAALCPAPPLLLPGLTGAAEVLPELRQACADAVSELMAADPDRVVVVGPAGVTTRRDPASRLAVGAYAPGLASGESGRAPLPLPLSLGVGAWLLDLVGYPGGRILQSVAGEASAERCAQVGKEIASWPGRVSLLVVADGSACRGLKAPGYLDERAAKFDAEVERAVRTGDLDALLAIDPSLASELMAAGRPAWQVLAGALGGQVVASEIRYCDDPFGVAYLVASIRV